MLGGKQSGGAKTKQPLGYTIIEVLIVLAVSGVMFVIAVNFVNGKQGKTAFSEGVNEMASRIQDVIEQVTDGQYSDIPISCSYTPGLGGGTVTDTGGGAQGEHPTCVFLGKIIHLDQNSATSPEYEVFSIAGGRVDSTTGNPLQDADPKTIKDLITQETMPQSLYVTHVVINGTAGPYYGIGFLQSPGAFDDSGVLKNGAQTVGMYYVDGLTAGQNRSGAQASIDVKNAFNIKPTDNADICVTDGSRYAKILIGNTSLTTGGQLSVTVKMRGAASC